MEKLWLLLQCKEVRDSFGPGYFILLWGNNAVLGLGANLSV